jgi:hypothetical protein
MSSIKEQMLTALYIQAINVLVDKKYSLYESFANAEINYAEYEERLGIIENELDCLTQ